MALKRYINDGILRLDDGSFIKLDTTGTDDDCYTITRRTSGCKINDGRIYIGDLNTLKRLNRLLSKHIAECDGKETSNIVILDRFAEIDYE